MIMVDSRTRLQQLQSEEMALRRLVDSVSDYTRSDVQHLLDMVREEIKHERERMLGERHDEEESA